VLKEFVSNMRKSNTLKALFNAVSAGLKEAEARDLITALMNPPEPPEEAGAGESGDGRPAAVKKVKRKFASITAMPDGTFSLVGPDTSSWTAKRNGMLVNLEAGFPADQWTPSIGRPLLLLLFLLLLLVLLLRRRLLVRLFVLLRLLLLLLRLLCLSVRLPQLTDQWTLSIEIALRYLQGGGRVRVRR
jgi:hypothetical protein